MDIKEAIERLTARTFGYRFYLENKRSDKMALELKGLKGDALKAAANMDRIRAAYATFNATASAHAADVESLPPQIAAMQDDLTFAAQVLGNSVANSSAGVDPPKTDIVSPLPGSAASTDPASGDAPERNVFNG